METYKTHYETRKGAKYLIIDHTPAKGGDFGAKAPRKPMIISE